MTRTSDPPSRCACYGEARESDGRVGKREPCASLPPAMAGEQQDGFVDKPGGGYPDFATLIGKPYLRRFGTRRK